MDTAALWSAIGTVASAVAGVAALIVAFLAYGATRRASDAAAAMTRIEARRDWAEMIPQFEVSIQAQTDLYALMQVALVGPLRLDRLDEIQLSIRDDFPARGASPLAGGPDAEQVANHVWGPYRFRHGVDGGSTNGRNVAPFKLPMGEGTKFALDRQQPPSWSTSGTEVSWRRDYEGQAVRLLLKCRREGSEPWSIPMEVFVTPLPKPEIPQQTTPVTVPDTTAEKGQE